jgi:hypothetical protein
VQGVGIWGGEGVEGEATYNIVCGSITVQVRVWRVRGTGGTGGGGHKERREPTASPGQGQEHTPW